MSSLRATARPGKAGHIVCGQPSIPCYLPTQAIVPNSADCAPDQAGEHACSPTRHY